jgi:uncharacterized membrane protein YphA (DoxX/SURF4 family)
MSQIIHDSTGSVSRRGNVLVWIMIIVCIIGFGGAGIAKVMGAEALAEEFTGWGLPLWFMTLVGVAEILGALGLLINGISTFSALGLAGIAAGALVTHAVNPPLQAGIPALALFVIALVVAYLRLGPAIGFLMSFVPDEKIPPRATPLRSGRR